MAKVEWSSSGPWGKMSREERKRVLNAVDEKMTRVEKILLRKVGEEIGIRAFGSSSLRELIVSLFLDERFKSLLSDIPRWKKENMKWLEEKLEEELKKEPGKELEKGNE